MAGKLERFAKEEFETILRERNVVENLNRLEDLMADARRRRARGVESGEGEVVPYVCYVLSSFSISFSVSPFSFSIVFFFLCLLLETDGAT